MNQELFLIEKKLQQAYHQKQTKVISLFSGIDLAYVHFKADSFSLHHKPLDRILQINYCKAGRVGWETGTGNYCYLGPGNFSVHGMDVCGDSVMLFPTGEYEGLLLAVDLDEATKSPPDLLAGTALLEKLLPERYCQDGKMLSFAGNPQTDAIFSGFYQSGGSLHIAHQKLKAVELLLLLAEMPLSVDRQLTEYRSEQVEAVRKIHQYLLSNMEQHITIDELSKQYHINPTTLKATFKSVYGTSIAAHIKEHRMEKAAKLLTETDLSIAQIAQAVGYDSQGKFTTAFKSFFETLPKDYRKQKNDSNVRPLSEA